MRISGEDIRGAIDVLFAIMLVLVRTGFIAYVLSKILHLDFTRIFMVLGCLHQQDGIFSVLCTVFQAAVPAYIAKEVLHLDFNAIFLIMVCMLKWDCTIGITLFAMYMIHHYMPMYSNTEKGQTIGTTTGTVSNDISVLLTRDARNDRRNGTSTARGSAEDDEIQHSKSLPMATSKANAINGKKLKNRKKNNAKVSRSSASDSELPQGSSILKSKTHHPGLNEFHQWMGAISDMYRIYTIATRNDESIIPIIPRSERGQVSLRMIVHNKTPINVEVYWIDYKGRETLKGSMVGYGGKIEITTWVGHPWIFRAKESGRLMLNFVPYRIIPIIESQYVTLDDMDSTGSHEFSIVTAKNSEDMCAVQDDLFPYPPSRIDSVHRAIDFSIQQMERERMSPRILLKYLTNIAMHPNESKYRQIRIANKTFWSSVWCNGGRGVLQALGFEEHGPNVEMGPNTGNLPAVRVQHLSNAIVMLEEFLKDLEDTSKPLLRQPKGADGTGSGRANWRV